VTVACRANDAPPQPPVPQQGAEIDDHTLHLNRDEIAARRAIDGLRNAGVPDSAIRLLSGRALRGVRAEMVGGFARPVGPDAPVGTFADRVLLRRQSAGAFAGDPDAQRQGSFADNDGVTVVSYEDGTERSRLTGRRALRRHFRATALDDATVARADDALRGGHAVVVVAATAIPLIQTPGNAELTEHAA
jgi:hypothetical protein